MPKLMKVQIDSQEGNIYSGEVAAVYATGEEGELGLLPGHTQLLTTIAPGPIRLVHEDGKEEMLYVSGGVLEVQPAEISILANSVERPEDLDAEKAEAARQEAEKLLSGKGEVDYKKTRLDLAEAMAKLRVVQLMQQKRKNH